MYALSQELAADTSLPMNFYCAYEVVGACTYVCVHVLVSVPVPVHAYMQLWE